MHADHPGAVQGDGSRWLSGPSRTAVQGAGCAAQVRARRPWVGRQADTGGASSHRMQE